MDKTTTIRLTHQLKSCWNNLKTQRMKELSQESIKRSQHPLVGIKKLRLVVARMKIKTETRIKRTTLNNIQQDQALHELGLQREKILIERENNLLEHEKKLYDLQIHKIKLDIED
ncbi:uncharacterized protein LOC114363003 [Ostrinia furnacalis]|uniref:uncharacterized protein LOC114363003 n=1 Tax=Ostrinia furnacalis TaxID=93504 RepID=UPI00103FDC24|nr:uncharacterized protein LOC114363003 [Ostrinia furnacalis]